MKKKTICRDLASLSTGHGEEACRWGHPKVAALDEGFRGASHAKSVEEKDKMPSNHPIHSLGILKSALDLAKRNLKVSD